MNHVLQKSLHIFLNAIPVLVMIGCIPLVSNDLSLTFLYIGIAILAFVIQKQKYDVTVFVFGFLIMIACEYLFVSTGVETFIRRSLFGIMPLWLPFLWAYGFVAIKRSVQILGK